MKNTNCKLIKLPYIESKLLKGCLMAVKIPVRVSAYGSAPELQRTAGTTVEICFASDSPVPSFSTKRVTNSCFVPKYMLVPSNGLR